MTFDQYITAWAGKGIDTDNAFGNQCMDNMHRYCQDVLGLDLSVLAAPAAKDVFLNFNSVTGHDHFDKIDNTPTGVPQKGDIMFWGTGIGPYGHVAIFKDGDTNKFNSFDQNWSGHQYCETVNHSYTGVLGWLHPKSQPQTVDPNTIDELRLARDKNWNLYQEEVKSNNELTKQLQDEQTKSQDLRIVLDKQTKADADTGAQLVDAQHSVTTLQSVINAHHTLFNVTTESDYQKAVEALKKPIDEQLKPLQQHAITLNNELPSLEKKKTSKKDINLIQRLGGFLSGLLTR